jgi:hypothetical protein
MPNPIFVEYYSHDACDCYKVRNPWTHYGSETVVLCKVDEGIEKAKRLCTEVINKKLAEALQEPVMNTMQEGV